MLALVSVTSALSQKGYCGLCPELVYPIFKDICSISSSVFSFWSKSRSTSLYEDQLSNASLSALAYPIQVDYAILRDHLLARLIVKTPPVHSFHASATTLTQDGYSLDPSLNLITVKLINC
jgi:hypothetical protein